MSYQIHHDTNPASYACDYFNVDWDTVCWHTWHCPYEETVQHTVENRDGDWISISIYRLPNGTYELTAYNAGK